MFNWLRALQVGLMVLSGIQQLIHGNVATFSFSYQGRQYLLTIAPQVKFAVEVKSIEQR